jgi:Ser/Thr protein kinase RdoA (MazF antagonist)
VLGRWRVKALPGRLAALVSGVVGEIAVVADRSWPRENSAVWEVTDVSGGRWFVKRHPSGRTHDREVFAYRHWASALGPGRAPVLAAADRQLLAVIVSGLPGYVVRDMRLAAGDEREVHRQGGILLRRFHQAAPPVRGGFDADAVIGRVDEHLCHAAGLLTPREAALIRSCAVGLARLVSELSAVPAHGDLQPRNWLWDPAARRLAVIDFERADPAPAVRDLVRLEYGAWDQRPDLRDAFMGGYGRMLTSTETKAMRCLAALDALSGLHWGTSNHDHEVTSRARRTLDHLLAVPP